MFQERNKSEGRSVERESRSKEEEEREKENAEMSTKVTKGREREKEERKAYLSDEFTKRVFFGEFPIII